MQICEKREGRRLAGAYRSCVGSKVFQATWVWDNNEKVDHACGMVLCVRGLLAKTGRGRRAKGATGVDVSGSKVKATRKLVPSL